MKKVYFLSTCDTSKRIISEFALKNLGFEFQDIKFEAISSAQLVLMKNLAGSYEALFSKVARKYKSMGLKNQSLSEAKMKELILTEYTFLKRPVIIMGDQIFVGSSKANIDKLRIALV